MDVHYSTAINCNLYHDNNIWRLYRFSGLVLLTIKHPWHAELLCCGCFTLTSWWSLIGVVSWAVTMWSWVNIITWNRADQFSHVHSVNSSNASMCVSHFLIHLIVCLCKCFCNFCSSMCKECHILRNHELQSTMEIQNQPFVVCECGTIPFANLKSSSLVDPDEPGRAPSGDIHPPPFNSRHMYKVSTLSSDDNHKLWSSQSHSRRVKGQEVHTKRSISQCFSIPPNPLDRMLVHHGVTLSYNSLTCLFMDMLSHSHKLTHECRNIHVYVVVKN